METVIGCAISTLFTLALVAGSGSEKSKDGKSVNARLEALEQQLLAFNSTIHERISRIDVSFEVTSSTPYSTVYGNQIYKLDTVTLNKGAGYHAPTGVFEAPVSGTYLFWASILPASHRVHVKLHKEGRCLALAVSNVVTSASLSYIVHVRRGEKVWFQAAGYQTTIIGHGHSSYGGTLMHKK